MASRILVLNPYLTVIRCSDDEILVRHGTRSKYSEIIRNDGGNGLLGRLLPHFCKPVLLLNLIREASIPEEEEKDTLEVIEYLAKRNVLVDPSWDLAQQYSDTILGSTFSGVNRLNDVVIGLVGCGQLGTKIGEELAVVQPKGFVLLDPRPLHQSRWNSKIGTTSSPDAKLDATLLDRLNKLHLSQLDIIAADDIVDEVALRKVFDTSNFVLVCYESFSPTLLHAANEQAIRSGTPWMSVYFDGSEAIIGPTYVPGQSACYQEFETQSESTLSFKDAYRIYKTVSKEQIINTGALVLPPHAMAAAGIAITSLLRFLATEQTFTIGRAIRVNFETLSIDYQEVMKLPRCPACSPLRPPYRHSLL
jgi:thiazole/oxazole-forming peptide maturase SagC family component